MTDDRIWIVMESGYEVKNGLIPYVNLYSRDYADKTKTITHSFQYTPYFYCPANEAERGHELITSVEPEVKIDAKGREIKRVNVAVPYHVPKVRDIYSWTDESDLVFDKRFLVDHKIRYAYKIVDDKPVPVEVEHVLEPRIVHFDIEVRSPEGIFPHAKDAEYPIISIQILDNYTDNIAVFTYQVEQTNDPCHIVCKTEKELITMFIQYVKAIDVDILAAWNSDQFDIPYLIKRSEKVGASLNGLSRYGRCRADYNSITGKFRCYTPGRAVLDQMEAFKKYNIGKGQRESNGLKSVISDEDLLGNAAFSYQDIAPILDKVLNEKRWDDFISYCKNDVIALRVIDKELGLYNFFETTRSIAGNKIMDGLHNSLVIEMYVMHEGIRAMPRKQYGGEKKKFEGALVVTPTFGMHEWVSTVDLNALYPHIICGFSVSPDIDGVVAKSTKKLMDLREVYREQKKQGQLGAGARDSSCKSLVNSVYGIMGAKSARLYDRDKAEFITKTGQEINRYIQELCKQKGKTIMYGDSVGHDTKVKVYNSNDTWKYTTVEELFTQVDFTRGDKEYCNLTDCFVESIDESGKLILDEVPYIMRHKCGKQMYRIIMNKSEYWYIDVTEDHSIIGYKTHKKHKIACKNQCERFTEASVHDLIVKDIKSIITKRKTHSIVNSRNYDTLLYEYLGYHLGNGSLHKGGEKGNKKYYYAGVSFGNDVDELYPYFIDGLKSKGIINSIWNSKRGEKFRGDVRFNGYDLIKLIREEIGHSSNKIVPRFMYEESVENIQAFVRGYFTADGTISYSKCSGYNIACTSVNENIVNGIRELLYILGISSTISEGFYTSSYHNNERIRSYYISVIDDKRYSKIVGFITSRKNERIALGKWTCKMDENSEWWFNHPYVVRKLDNYDGYVYDLHCKKTNRYFANNILVHNTDSVFISEVKSGSECVELETYLNDELAKWSDAKGSLVHFKLKSEKLFRRLLFKPKSDDRNKTGKKKYAGHLIWEEGTDCDEFKFMGLEIKRSDNPKITKECLKFFLETAIIEGDTQKAIKCVRNNYKSVLNGQVDPYDISIPKELRKLEYDKKNSWLDGKAYAEKEYNYVIQEGEKPRLLYLKEGRVICIDDGFDTSKIIHDIDWKVMAEKTIKDKMESYIWSLGLNWESAINGQNTLDAWF